MEKNRKGHHRSTKAASMDARSALSTGTRLLSAMTLSSGPNASTAKVSTFFSVILVLSAPLRPFWAFPGAAARGIATLAGSSPCRTVPCMDSPDPDVRAEELARMPVDLSFATVARSLPTRAREAMLVCAAVSLFLVVVALAQVNSPGGWPAAVCVGATAYLVYFAGAKTSHVSRWLRLRRLLRDQPDQVLDVVGFAYVTSVPSGGRAGVGLVPAIRVHDTVETALAEESVALDRPAWWSSAQPTSHVYFDGSRLRRDGPVQTSGVLLQTVLDEPQLGRRVSAGQPVRVVGSESASVLMTNGSLLWPRGSWIAGG